MITALCFIRCCLWEDMQNQRNNNTETAARFGTFQGVFVPNVLTILGIILFLRMGWVVGQAGLWGALAIVMIANTISFLTGLSLSAVATSMKVEAGGNYYLISRSLGLEIGGAIGIPLFLSQAISVAFYIIGFTEAVLALDAVSQVDPRVIATLVTLAFCIIAYIGADFGLKIQYFILAVLVASIVSFFTGGWDSIIEPNLVPNYTEGISFWVVFAVFFPAVTGIEIGTSLSGDLKDPSRSIPIGTILSILVTAVIYVLVIVWFAFQSTPDQLINDSLAMQRIASVPVLIIFGVVASTLSSALGSVLAAPRTLQAIAQDGVVPRWIASNLGSATEPRMAVLVTGAIAGVVIWMGDLDFVAPIITMFFLNTYGMVNLAATIERLVANPSFRPEFHIPWWVSLLGAIGCYTAMFLISPIATFVAVLFSYGVFFALERRELLRAWGDVRSGIWFTLARFALLKLEKQERHSKNWRPNLMVFTGQPHNREHLVEMAKWLSLGRGIVTFFQLIVASKAELHHTSALRETARKHIADYIQKNGLKAFAEAESVADFKEGLLTLAQAHGIGKLSANTILMGWSRTQEGRIQQLGIMRELFYLRKSVLLLKVDTINYFRTAKRIDIWWQGRGQNEELMLLLAYLISSHNHWHKAEVRLLRIINSASGIEDSLDNMRDLLKSAHIEAIPQVIVRDDATKSIAQIIADHSQFTDLTILGMHLPATDELATYSERLEDLVKCLNSVLLVRNAEVDMNFLIEQE